MIFNARFWMRFSSETPSLRLCARVWPWRLRVAVATWFVSSEKREHFMNASDQLEWNLQLHNQGISIKIERYSDQLFSNSSFLEDTFCSNFLQVQARRETFTNVFT